MTKDVLTMVLVDADLPLETWGKGGAKTIQHLFDEMEAGETQLVLGQGIERLVRTIGLVVFYEIPGGSEKLFLKEAKQVFLADGMERVRKLETSLGEKIIGDESPMSAIRRALAGELEIFRPLPIIPGPIRNKTEESLSYPGLRTRYEIHTCSVSLPADLFRQSGFKINEPDKTVYYVWTKEKPKYF